MTTGRGKGSNFIKRKLPKIPVSELWSNFGSTVFWENGAREMIFLKPQSSSPLKTSSALVTDPGIEVDKIMHVSLIWKWHEVKENFSPHLKTNVVIAAFVTAQECLKRYFFLELFSEPIIYAGTDSLVFTQKPVEVASNTGEFLGDVTNEIDRYGP